MEQSLADSGPMVSAAEQCCRRDGATVYLGVFRVRLERVSRCSADGPEPGRGQGLGAPWTPPPIRCERSGPSRPPRRCAISSVRIVRESEPRRGHGDVAAAGRQGAVADSHLVARRPSVTAPPPPCERAFQVPLYLIRIAADFILNENRVYNFRESYGTCPASLCARTTREGLG
ncbi:unnamed protein product [Danaus chrysippus]|uniref:(African queen) hypothetical protein n=1 Tax=Danaus chrysippus TaxID=151541 RepID=A0A8J2QU99_9NEOP|nr:unnamed protein product [Danaus chrysippus]